ncbi:hypothetical protein Q0M94_27615 (plasmid) [Deinococcus radiomollis]
MSTSVLVARPTPTVMVARTIAFGQAITMADAAAVNAKITLS